MIISLSGKIGSGKDLTGKIFQSLLDDPKCFDKFDEVTEEAVKNAVLDNPKYKIKKFADKLKDMICILLDCTREQLEDREFKEKELGEEWWYWILNREGGYGNTLLDYNTTSQETLDIYTGLKLIKLTPRLLLQLLGTECGRDIIHPNIWINALMSEYKPYNKGKAHDLVDWSELYIHIECGRCKKSYNGHKRQIFCKECIEDDTFQIYPSWIITDTRFPNELEAIKSRGGITIRVNRAKIVKLSKNTSYVYNPLFDGPEHESETALDNQAFYYVINNDGSIKDLIKEVKKIINLLKHHL